MPKFYVQSGDVRTVVDSEDAERAALWCVHSTIGRVVPLDACDAFEDEGMDETNEVANQSVTEPLPVRLSSSICVSEIGFDRSDAARFNTLEMLQHWFELVQAIERLSLLM